MLPLKLVMKNLVVMNFISIQKNRIVINSNSIRLIAMDKNLKIIKRLKFKFLKLKSKEISRNINDKLHIELAD